MGLIWSELLIKAELVMSERLKVLKERADDLNIGRKK